MSYKDICQSWVDVRKHEDDEGMFWIDEPVFVKSEATFEREGPYTEEEIDDILWKRATDGEAIEQFVT